MKKVEIQSVVVLEKMNERRIQLRWNWPIRLWYMYAYSPIVNRNIQMTITGANCEVLKVSLTELSRSTSTAVASIWSA